MYSFCLNRGFGFNCLFICLVNMLLFSKSEGTMYFKIFSYDLRQPSVILSVMLEILFRCYEFIQAPTSTLGKTQDEINNVGLIALYYFILS